MSDETEPYVYIGLGMLKSQRSVLVLVVNSDETEATIKAAERGREYGCDAVTVIKMTMAARFAADFRLWLCDVAGIVGAEALDLVRHFGATMVEMMDEIRSGERDL